MTFNKEEYDVAPAFSSTAGETQVKEKVVRGQQAHYMRTIKNLEAAYS